MISGCRLSAVAVDQRLQTISRQAFASAVADNQAVCDEYWRNERKSELWQYAEGHHFICKSKIPGKILPKWKENRISPVHSRSPTHFQINDPRKSTANMEGEQNFGSTFTTIAYLQSSLAGDCTTLLRTHRKWPAQILKALIIFIERGKCTVYVAEECISQIIGKIRLPDPPVILQCQCYLQGACLCMVLQAVIQKRG